MHLVCVGTCEAEADSVFTDVDNDVGNVFVAVSLEAAEKAGRSILSVESQPARTTAVEQSEAINNRPRQ